MLTYASKYSHRPQTACLDPGILTRIQRCSHNSECSHEPHKTHRKCRVSPQTSRCSSRPPCKASRDLKVLTAHGLHTQPKLTLLWPALPSLSLAPSFFTSSMRWQFGGRMETRPPLRKCHEAGTRSASAICSLSLVVFPGHPASWSPQSSGPGGPVDPEARHQINSYTKPACSETPGRMAAGRPESSWPHPRAERDSLHIPRVTPGFESMREALSFRFCACSSTASNCLD